MRSGENGRCSLAPATVPTIVTTGGNACGTPGVALGEAGNKEVCKANAVGALGLTNVSVFGRATGTSGGSG